jgi:RHS repeat-associated protein
MVRNGQSYFYHLDGLGSVTAITDSSGTVVQRYEYDSFGNIVSMLDPNFKQPYTYTSREYDEETGLYYYRARYYDAKTGRFISEDPIGFAGGINLYSYVGNNPVNFVDPIGLWRISGGFGGVIGPIDINWSSSDPTKTNFYFTTPQLGGGLNICFNRQPKKEDKCNKKGTSKELPLEEVPSIWSAGSKYAGVSFTDNFDSICINIGRAGGPLPINVETPLGSIDWGR